MLLEYMHRTSVLIRKPRQVLECEMWRVVCFVALLSLREVQSGDSELATDLIRKQPVDLTENHINYYEQDVNLLSPEFYQFYSILSNLTEKQCKQDVENLFAGILHRERWAMSMFDAAVKFPQGILYGHSYHLGNFDECIASKSPIIEDSQILGQYCLAELTIKNNTEYKYTSKFQRSNKDNVSLHWAFCVPSSCSSQDVENFLNEFLKNMLGDSVRVKVPEVNCHFTKKIPVNRLELTYCTIIALFLLFVLSTTVYHGVHIYRKKYRSQYSLDRSRKDYPLYHELLIAFSLLRNVNKIIEVKSTNNEFNLDCICGIRVLSMGLILAGHSLIFLVTSPVINANYYEEELIKVQYSPFLNSPLLVDTFLLLSGFLFCRLFLQELDKRKGKVNVLVLYIGRYIRLTPAYAVVIGFYCTFLVRLSDGPFWDKKIGLEQNRCLESWWTNLLYINNYLNTDHLCMFQSWYLSVDTQLFILAPLIMYPLWKFPKFGQAILGTCVIVTTALPFAQTYLKKLDPTLLVFPPEITDIQSNYYFKTAYIKTDTRATGYVIGLLFGYIVYRIQGKKISSLMQISGNILATICGFTSMFSIILLYSPNYSPSELESATYASLHRLFWCFAIGWIILICATNNCYGYINAFLSSKAFAPFSRLTYCAYLVNGIVEIYSSGIVRVPKALSVHNLAVECFGHIVLTILAAFALCVIFESPIHNLEKIMIRRVGNKKKVDADGYDQT